MRTRPVVLLCAATLLGACGGAPPPPAPRPPEPAPDPARVAAARVASVELSPSPLMVEVGDTIVVRGVLRDSAGVVVEGAEWGIGAEGGADVRSIKERQPESYELWGLEPGAATLAVFAGLPAVVGDEPNWTLIAEVPVEVRSRVGSLAIAQPRFAPYTGTSFRLEADVRSTTGAPADAEVHWSTSNPAVARVQSGGRLSLFAPGTVQVYAQADAQADTLALEVEANPVRRLRVTVPDGPIRAGAEIALVAEARDARGRPLEDAAVLWEVRSVGGEGAGSARITDDGRFTAARAGRYRVTAVSGTVRESVEIDVTAG